MNEIWTLVADQRNPQHYISAAEIWVEFAAKFFTVKEVNRVLGDIINHLLPDRAYESCSAVLLSILERLIRHLRSFSLLLSMDKFMPFIDMLQKEEARLEAAKLLLDAYTKYHHDSTLDPVVINGVLFASKIVHDSISSLSSEDEKRSASGKADTPLGECLRKFYVPKKSFCFNWSLKRVVEWFLCNIILKKCYLLCF